MLKLFVILTTTWLIIPAILLTFPQFRSNKRRRSFLIVMLLPVFFRFIFDKRVGAECCDGTNSVSVGSGTCSWHTGVCYWRYECFTESYFLILVCGGNASYSVPTFKSLF
jgi:hypothetical protein